MKTPPPTLDHEALDAAVDAERRRRGMSWSQVTDAANIGPNVFTRLRDGGLPSATTLVRILLWLGNTDLDPYIRRS